MQLHQLHYRFAKWFLTYFKHDLIILHPNPTSFTPPPLSLSLSLSLFLDTPLSQRYPLRVIDPPEQTIQRPLPPTPTLPLPPNDLIKLGNHKQTDARGSRYCPTSIPSKVSSDTCSHCDHIYTNVTRLVCTSGSGDQFLEKSNMPKAVLKHGKTVLAKAISY